MSNVINAVQQFGRRQDQIVATQRCNVYLDRIQEEGKHEHLLDLLVADGLRIFLASDAGVTLIDTNYAYGNDPKSFTEECSRHTFQFNLFLVEKPTEEIEWSGVFTTFSERYIAPDEFEQVFAVDVARRAADRAARLVKQHEAILQHPVPKVADLYSYISQQITVSRYTLVRVELIQPRDKGETQLRMQYAGRNPKGEATLITSTFYVGRLIEAYGEIERIHNHQ